MTARRPFRFAVVGGASDSGAAWIAGARRAEELGFDLLLAPDTRFTPSPFPALAAAAASTARLRVAPWVLAAPLRTPAAVAREATALQMLSDARFELGIGTGRPDAEDEARRLGMPWGGGAERLRQLLATIDAVRADVRPVPSVLVAAGGPRGLEAAGRAADTVALALPPTAPVDAVRRAADLARAAGNPELAISVSGVAGRPIAHLGRSGLGPDALGDAAGFLPGDAADSAERLRALADAAGVTFLAVAGEQAEAFAPVIPLLRA